MESPPKIVNIIQIKGGYVLNLQCLHFKQCRQTDLFTDTAAILNSLDLRSIMGCPGGMSTTRYTRSVFTRAFRANFSLSFPRKRL